MGELKTVDTMARVIGLLLQLIERPMSYEDMFEYFNQTFKSSVYSKEVLNKYLNTLRAAGLEIQRSNGGQYSLCNFFTAISLTKEEIKAFKDLEVAVLRYGTTENMKTFINFKRKIIKFYNYKTQQELNVLNIGDFTSEMTLKVKFFQKLCEDNQKIKIKYENKIYVVEPKEVLFIDNTLYLECYNTNLSKISKFLLNKTVLMEQQPSKNTNINSSTSVLYELSGRLANIYKLKEGESVIAQNDSKMFIKAETNDYEFLCRRLIRYENFCKIIKPLDFKEYFIKYTERILDLYKDKL